MLQQRPGYHSQHIGLRLLCHCGRPVWTHLLASEWNEAGSSARVSKIPGGENGGTYPSSRDLKNGISQEEFDYRDMLAWLWYTCVKHILDELAFIKRPLVVDK